MVICFAADCVHRSGRDKCSFYRFPQDPRKHALWTRVSRRADRDPQPYARLCSCHFADGKKENGPSFFSYNQKSRFTFKSPEKRRRKVLAIHKEAGFLSGVQEGSNVKQILSSVQLAASIKTYSKHTNNSVYRTTQDTNKTEKITCAPGNTNSAQVPLSSAAVKSNCALPFAESSVGSFSATEPVSKNNNCSILIKNNNTFTLPLASNPDTCVSPVISDSSSKSVSKISYANCLPLPVVSNTVCGSNISSRIPKDHPSILSNISTVVKDILPTKKNLITHRSVARRKNVRKNKTIKLKRSPKQVPIQGRRIIDFQYFFNSLQDVNNHSKAGCNLNNMIITEEKINGICTSYVIKCIVCNFQKLIWSENPSKEQNLNTDFVSGILSIKCNFEKANVLLTKMDLPPLKSADFIKAFNEVSAPLDKTGGKKTYWSASKNLCKNVQREPQLAIMEQCLSTSDNNNLFHDDLLIEDQFEIKEENFVETENESETVVPYITMRKPDGKLIAAPEKVLLNTTTIKRETYSDDEDFSRSIINETTNKENVIVNDEQTILESVLPKQNEVRKCEKAIVNGKQVSLQKCAMIENNRDNNILTKPVCYDKEKTETMTDCDNEPDSELIQMRISGDKLIAAPEKVILNTTIKQETYSDDEDLSRSIINETINKENFIVNDKQTILVPVLSKQNKVRKCEKNIVNEEQVSLQKCVMIENNRDNILTKPVFYDMEKTEKESVTDYDNEHDSEFPSKKARTVTHKKSNKPANVQEISTNTNKEQKSFQSKHKSNGPVITTSSVTSGLNVLATPVTDLESTAATSSITTGGEGNITFLIPVQHLPNLMKMVL